MNGDAFRAYVEQVLVPELNKGDVVIMDNLPAHKVGTIKTMIEDTGARFLYLPPYSPDFYPIEIAISKLNAILRKTSARTINELWLVIAEGIEKFPAKDAEITSPRQDMTWIKLNIL